MTNIPEVVPFVSVVIPVFNDAVRIAECLAALGRQSYPKDRYEVIVVDNGSTDKTGAEVQRHPTVRLLVEPRRGSYRARNRGISSARGDIVAFTDSDCTPVEVWLTEGVRCLRADSNIGLVAGHVTVYPADPAKRTLAELYELCFAFPQERYIEFDRFGATANVFTRISILRDVGVFDERLESGADREWGQRVAKHGWALRYSDKAVVRHPARRTWQDLSDKKRRVFRGLAAMGVSLSWWGWIRSLLETAPDVIHVLRTRVIGLRWKPSAVVALLRMRVLQQRLRLTLVRGSRAGGAG